MSYPCKDKLVQGMKPHHLELKEFLLFSRVIATCDFFFLLEKSGFVFVLPGILHVSTVGCAVSVMNRGNLAVLGLSNFYRLGEE